MLTLEKLREYGADVDKGIARCAGSEALYLRLTGMVIDELASGALAEAVAQGDLDKAFETAHKLKGGAGNVGLTPVERPVSELTELLRAKAPGDHRELLEAIGKESDKLKALLHDE